MNTLYQKENIIVQEVAQRLITIVNHRFGRRLVVKTKSDQSDVVSTLDWKADQLLVNTIQKHFRNDTLVTEESSPETPIGSGRTWVIDPICGSRNLSRGLRIFVSNIALVAGDRVVAAWVVDHSRGRVLWDIGTGLHDDGKKIPHLSESAPFPLINVDWGYFRALSTPVRRAYTLVASDILLDKKLSSIDVGSSLGFTYVATGQFQGSITININAWDFAAGAFLVERNGGIVTNFDGSPWSLKSKSIVLAATHNVHKKLLQYIRMHNLEKIR